MEKKQQQKWSDKLIVFLGGAALALVGVAAWVLKVIGSVCKCI
jgi:hypothetical protein